MRTLGDEDSAERSWAVVEVAVILDEGVSSGVRIDDRGTRTESMEISETRSISTAASWGVGQRSSPRRKNGVTDHADLGIMSGSQKA